MALTLHCDSAVWWDPDKANSGTIPVSSGHQLRPQSPPYFLISARTCRLGFYTACRPGSPCLWLENPHLQALVGTAVIATLRGNDRQRAWIGKINNEENISGLKSSLKVAAGVFFINGPFYLADKVLGKLFKCTRGTRTKKKKEEIMEPLNFFCLKI